MTIDRIPASFGPFIQLLGKMVEGLTAGASGDRHQEQFHAALSGMLHSLVRMDRKQEGLKVQLVATTRDLVAVHRTAKTLMAQVVCYLEGVYGKNSLEMLQYGVSPRRKSGGKRVSATPQAPAA